MFNMYTQEQNSRKNYVNVSSATSLTAVTKSLIRSNRKEEGVSCGLQFKGIIGSHSFEVGRHGGKIRRLAGHITLTLHKQSEQKGARL